MSFIEDRHKMIERFGPEVRERRTGKSMANCFSILSQAILNRNTEIPLYDHYSNNSQILQYTTIPKLEEIIKKMNLEGFTVNKSKLTITYNLD